MKTQNRAFRQEELPHDAYSADAVRWYYHETKGVWLMRFPFKEYGVDLMEESSRCGFELERKIWWGHGDNPGETRRYNSPPDQTGTINLFPLHVPYRKKKYIDLVHSGDLRSLYFVLCNYALDYAFVYHHDVVQHSPVRDCPAEGKSEPFYIIPTSAPYDLWTLFEYPQTPMNWNHLARIHAVWKLDQGKKSDAIPLCPDTKRDSDGRFL